MYLKRFFTVLTLVINVIILTGGIALAGSGNLIIFFQTAKSGDTCLLYDSNYTHLPAYDQTLDSSKTATWNAIPSGDYFVELYELVASPFSGNELKISKNVSVTDSTTTNLTLNFNMPYVYKVERRFFDNDSMVSPSARLYPGTRVKINFKVKNLSDETRQCKLKFIADRNKDTTYDIQPPERSIEDLTAGAETTITEIISAQQPETISTIDLYDFAYKLDTNIHGTDVKTSSADWADLFQIISLPKPANTYRQLNLSGIDWKVLDWAWQAGLYHSNVYFNAGDYSHINLRLLDNSGVGAQLNSADNNFYYGYYQAALHITPTPTTDPEGAVASFFYYWSSADGKDYQEIDVELRTQDINVGTDGENNPVSYVTFTVHNKKRTDGPAQTVAKSIVCPVSNVHLDHLYAFNWTETSVSFYIDGTLATDINNNPAIVDNDSFPNRIPEKRGTMILNIWSGSPSGTPDQTSWSGTPPQNKGDIIAQFSNFSYTPSSASDKTLTLSVILGTASFDVYSAAGGGVPVTSITLLGTSFNNTIQTYVTGELYIQITPVDTWQLRVYITDTPGVTEDSKIFSKIDPSKSFDFAYRFTGNDTSVTVGSSIPADEWPYPVNPGNTYSWFLTEGGAEPQPIMSSDETYDGRQRVIFGVRVPDNANQSGIYSNTIIFDLTVQ